MELKRRIVIFGAGPGLSQSIARLFGKQGFSVSLVARNEQRLQKLASELKTEDIHADYKVCDMADERMLTAAMKQYETEGMPEVVLFNAFMLYAGSFNTETWAHLKEEFDIDFGAAFNIIKRWLLFYQESGHEKLFFTGGGLALYPMAEYLDVSVTKAALRTMVYAAANSVADSSVHVATVTIKGNIGGENPKYAPEEIAKEYWTLYELHPSAFEVERIY